MDNMDSVKQRDMKDLANYIWKSLNIIRGDIPANDYDVILFLLAAYKDEVIDFSEVINPFGLPQELKENIEKDPRYSQILKEFLPIIERIYAPNLNELFAQLNKINRTKLSENFEIIFEDLLFQISEYQKKGYGEMMQPKEVSRFIINLANLKNGCNIYNPFAGLGSYNLFLNESQSYYGQEYSKQTWALGMLRMFAHEKTKNTTYVQEDSIKQWNDREKFDLVVSSPPLRMSLPREYRSIFTNDPYRRVESFLIDKGIHSLKDSGKLIALLPLSFLFTTGGSERRLKETLIANDLIDSIISLPENLLKNTGVSLCVMVFKMAASRPGYVKFVDGSNFFEREKRRTRNTILLDEELIKVINQDQESSILKYVEVENIEANDFDLSVPRYFAKEVQGEKIGSFSTIIRGSIPEEGSKGRLVKIKDLKEDVLDNVIEPLSIEKSPVSATGIRRVQESCLLLALRWKTLKPSYFQFDGEAIYIRPDIIALKLDTSKIDVDYLIHELNSDYVSEQLSAVRSGTIIPMIRKVDLQNIKVQFPSELNDHEAKKKQTELIESIKESIRKERLKEAGLLQELEDFKKRYKEELESKQHNIRQHLKNVNDSVNVLRQFMQLNGGILRSEDIISQRRNITVQRRFDALKDSLDQVIFEINNITNELQFEEPEKLSLIKSLRTCVDGLGVLSNFNFEFDPDTAALQEAGIEDPEIIFSKRAFKEVFNNIIENATRHGFQDPNKTYTIEISLTVRNNFVFLDFLNNGRPWPKGLVEKLGAKGVKAGSSGNKGIGLWRVFETVNYYGGQYEIINQPKDTFPVGIRLKFELKND